MKKGLHFLSIILFMLSACDSPSIKEEPVAIVLNDIAFSQVDYYHADGSIGLADSLFGNIAWSYAPDPAITYYLNVAAALSPEDEPNWVIQNLPLFPSMDGDGAVRYESAFFNLAGLGLTSGTDLSEIFYSWTINDMIATTGPSPADKHTEVQTAEHHSCWAGDPVEIDFDYDEYYPKDIQIFDIPIYTIPRRDVSPVQEGAKGCMAGTFARGISWLDGEYGLAFHTTAQDIYEGLFFAGVSDYAFPNNEHWLAAALTYTHNQTANLIEFAAWDAGETIGSVDGVPETSSPLIEWLENVFETGVVGLTYRHPHGRHIVTAYDMYTQGGETFIMYRDDEYQGLYLGDNFAKHVKVYKKDGTYYFGSDNRPIEYAIAMLPAPSLVGSIVEHLQPFLLEGKIVYDLNGDGEENEGEPGAGGLEWGVKEKSCEADCEYVVLSKCDEEGYFSAEFVPEKDKIYTVEFMEVGWRQFAEFMDEFFGDEVYFGNFSADLPPDPNLTIPFPPMQYSFPDDLEDNINDKGELVNNPSGDIKGIVVGINPDNTLQLEINPVAIGGKDEPGGLFVYGGDATWVSHVSEAGEKDAGLFGGASEDGRPIILPSDGRVEFSVDKWIFTIPLLPYFDVDTLPPDDQTLEIRLYNGETIDDQVFTWDQLGFISRWRMIGLDRFSTE